MHTQSNWVQPSVLPGFGLTIGTTCTFLGLIVLVYVVVRLVISFVVLPRSVVDVSDEAAARAFARQVLVPILTGAPA